MSRRVVSLRDDKCCAGMDATSSNICAAGGKFFTIWRSMLHSKTVPTFLNAADCCLKVSSM